MNVRQEFIVAVDPEHDAADAETWGRGPMCECPQIGCTTYLPIGAWRHVVSAGQNVVLPGHEEPGARCVDFEGWIVVEAEG